MGIMIAKLHFTFNDYKGWDQKLFNIVKKNPNIAQHNYVKKHYFG